MNPRATAVHLASNGTTLFASVTGAHSGIDSGTVYRSTNDGASWISVKSGLYSSYQSAYRHWLGFGSGGKVFAGSSAGIYASTNNGTSWFPSHTGLRNANALALTVSGTTLYAGHAGGIAQTQDEGATWVQVNNGLPPGTGVNGMAARGSYVFAAGGYIYRSSNNGSSWEQASNGISLPYISTIAAGTSALYAGSILGGVYVSTNDGANWTGPGSGLPGFGGVNTIYVDGTTIWAGISSNGIYRSTDNGATWAARSNGLPAFSRNVSSITRSGSTLFAGLTSSATGCVYVSTDNGANWTSASTGIPASSYCFALYSVGQFVFAGFNYSGTGDASGIYRTSDNGASWSPVNTGLPDPCSVNAFAVMGTNLYASYLGVWQRSLSQITGVREVGSDVPERFSLEQNSPNPFNPHTNIRFMIVDYGFVLLKVYDVLGREVATLVNHEMQPGSYEITWDANGLASGTYIYRLQAGSVVAAKTMTLIR